MSATVKIDPSAIRFHDTGWDVYTYGPSSSYISYEFLRMKKITTKCLRGIKKFVTTMKKLLRVLKFC